MDCHQAAEHLSPFLDGELESPREGALQVHLDGCPACRDHLQELERNRALLAALPRMPLPEDLLGRVVQAVESSGPRTRVALLPTRRPSWNGRRVLAAAAAVVLFCLGALTLLGYYSEEPGPQVAAQPVVNRHALDTGAPLLGEPPLWTTASYVVGGSRRSRR